MTVKQQLSKRYDAQSLMAAKIILGDRTAYPAGSGGYEWAALVLRRLQTVPDADADPLFAGSDWGLRGV
jgi:hypothetical protein